MGAGGKSRTGADGEGTEGGDHDPPAKQELVPFGLLRVASGAVRLRFGSRETSDAGVDALQRGWRLVKADLGPVTRRVISPDHGPKDAGRRTPFLKRMVQFADRSGLEIRLVSSPPYQSTDNRIGRCWSAWEQKGDGVLLNGLEVILQGARGMTWKGHPPTVGGLDGVHPDGVRVAAQGMKADEARLQRSATLPKYDIVIKPEIADFQVK